MLGIRTSEPLGRRKYWPMYEAAVAHDLPIGIHFGGQGGTPITGAGWPSFYLEDHAGMSTAFQAQVISLICEGVFEQFPELKIVLIEGGFAWVPPLAWRLDAAWRKLRDEVPRPEARAVRVLRRALLAHHPADGGAAVAAQFLEMLEHAPWLQDELMFSTDYPHWDFDAPDEALPKVKLPDGFAAKLMAENARALYKLPPGARRSATQSRLTFDEVRRRHGRRDPARASARSSRSAGGSIGVFNVGGEFFALLNRCPHQGGPLCLGNTLGFLRSGGRRRVRLQPRRRDPALPVARLGVRPAHRASRGSTRATVLVRRYEVIVEPRLRAAKGPVRGRDVPGVASSSSTWWSKSAARLPLPLGEGVG